MTGTARTWKGFADGFGGGVAGGAIYAGLVTVLGGNEPSPWILVFALATVLGLVEASRVRLILARSR
ncbi:MAG: hypothetical protein HY820_25945 [Acidobacteria bacterium]|nr:hypothetical protein [Acidobacteriota bacterium]